MSVKVFNPITRYIVVKIDHVYYPGDYGEIETVHPMMPVHYCDELKDAEDVAHALSQTREGRYEVYTNAVWKALDAQRHALKDTAFGEDLSIERRLSVASEVLHNMLEIPAYPEERKCERCGDITTQKLCAACQRYEDAAAQVCSCCGKTGCVPGLRICGMCKAAEASAERERIRKRRQEEAEKIWAPRTNGVALERSDAPDSPTSKPEGSGTWAK